MVATQVLAPASMPQATRSERSATLRIALGWLLLAALVMLAILRSQVGTRLDALTVDEAWHIVAGVEYARSGDYRLNPEHPPLSKRWVGAWMPDSFELRAKTPLTGKGAERDWTEETFYLENDFRASQQRARVAMYALHGALLLIFGGLVWHALGLGWAAGTLLFLALEPAIGAHLPLVMTDLSLALTLGIAAVCAGLLLARWQWRWALALGAAMGLALASKHSALPGVAILGALCTLGALVACGRMARCARAAGTSLRPAMRALAGRALQLGVAAALALAVLWGSYDFHFHAGADGSDDFNEAMADKVATLRIAHWRDGIGFADAHQLLPRPYLWGLADTVRAGVEGRGQALNLLWGTVYEGKAPWFTYPSYIVSKLPLGLLALTALGLLALAFGRGAFGADSVRPRAVILALCVLAIGHLLALGQSQGTYAGVRHALPVVIVLAVLGAAAIAVALRQRARLLGAATVACLAATVALTIRELRLWEYHNELAGGTAQAALAFGNEGLDLGQRAFELAALHDAVIAPTGLPLYSGYWFGEEQAKALGLNYARRVVDLDDTNVEGVYEGFVVYGMENHVPLPQWDHDPAEMYAGLERVARFGHIEVWRGRQLRPKARASSMSDRIGEYIYELGGKDWEKVAARSREVLDVLPKRFPDAIELGNAQLRLGRREEALAAYRQPLQFDVMDALTREQLEQRVAALERGDDLASLTPLVNPWRE
jgi:hypothetical protein